MGLTALVMAGGRGTHMALSGEKPLLRVGGKPMIEYVISALRGSKMVDEIVVAVSQHTPETAQLMKRFTVKILKTPGKGYVLDMRYAVGKLKLDTVLTISADLPLITCNIIDKIVERYRQCNKPALTVVVPLETKMRLGLGGEYVLKKGNKRLVPVGINVIDGRRIDEGELEEDIFIIDEDEVAVNANTPHDLEIAEHLFGEKLQRNTKG